MSVVEPAGGAGGPTTNLEDFGGRGAKSRELALQWRRLNRTATALAFLAIPSLLIFFHVHDGLAWWKAVLATLGSVVVFRGLIDLVFRRFIPWPTLFGAEDTQIKEEDVVSRKRAWLWKRLASLVFVYTLIITLVWALKEAKHHHASWPHLWLHSLGILSQLFSNPQILLQGLLVFGLFFVNFAILMGPLLLMGISQMKGYEPGDADWGVKLEDVRGQAEAKEEIRKVVTLWQSGEYFERFGGKRERGVLFIGPPGTGKTMLAKAIATSFNCPFVAMPGSGFAATFIGVDAIIVRFLARKAKRLARKWGGQCICFIDEIDAVGMRRQSLGQSFATLPPLAEPTFNSFYGPYGALTSSGDLILETQAWREQMFAARQSPSYTPPLVLQRLGGIVNQAFPGMFGGMGGQLALNQLLVVMDGLGSPRFLRRVATKSLNGLLDGVFVIPRRLGKLSLRLPKPKPANEQIYFIGATNVPLEALDPALTRPGRMGRHVWFRTPTKQDRLDIFDLYLDKVAHESELDTPEARDELARVASAYSPAMIDQVCSMALTYAHHAGRERFNREDLLEAMTTIESGMAIKIEYVPSETRAVAIHEAGHAVCAHVYMKKAESTRLSIRKRGGSLGHHQAIEKDERFSSWRSEEMGQLIWALGAMAAEYVFYGENSTGVGGDVQSATSRVAWMVGSCAMGPEKIALGKEFKSKADEAKAREQADKRFEELGLRIMNRASAASAMHGDPIQASLSDQSKRRAAAQILGQAFITAYQLVKANRDAVEHVAEVLIERQEIYGDELVNLLKESDIEVPSVDLTKDDAWPQV